MTKSGIFSAVSEFYQYSMAASCDYDKWAEYVINAVKTNAKGRSGFDMGCGSGHFTRALKRAGYAVTGVDLAPEMLVAAEKETAAAGLYVPYIAGDILKFKTNAKVDFITAVNDAFNCISGDNLKKAFARMNGALKKGGFFFFDVSSAYKLRNVIANNFFFEDDEDYSYIWSNRLFSDRVQMDMSIFVRRGELFEKKEACLTEYIHEEEFITRALAESGFKLIAAEGENGMPKTDKSERLNFLAEKI